VGDLSEIVDAVRRVGQGGSVLDPIVVSQLVGRRRADALEDVSEREREVLSLMAEGARTRRSPNGTSSPSAQLRSTSRASSPSSGFRPAPKTTAE
jgi:hypothetical protein